MDDCVRAESAEGRTARSGVSRGQSGSPAPEGRQGRGARQSADHFYEVIMGRGRFTGIIASLMGLMAASVAAHHSFSAGARLEQTDQADRQGHRDAMVQPARVDLHQRDRQGRQGREVGLGLAAPTHSTVADGGKKISPPAPSWSSTDIRRATDRPPPTQRASPSRTAAGCSPDRPTPTHRRNSW